MPRRKGSSSSSHNQILHDLRAAGFVLQVVSEALDDFEAVRIGLENRIRSIKQADPETHLYGLEERLEGVVQHEKELVKVLRRALRAHPLGPWVKATVGIGEKQGARLLGALAGDPLHRADGTPRTIGQLWAYCGYHVVPAQTSLEAQDMHGGDTTSDQLVSAHSSVESQNGPGGDTSSDTGLNGCDTHPRVAGVAPRRRKGQRANWNSKAKSRAFLVAESCIKKSHSPYRHVYEIARKQEEERLHETPCAQCKARVGEPLKKGHQHARAMRKTAKAILKDMWLQAREVSM